MQQKSIEQLILALAFRKQKLFVQALLFSGELKLTQYRSCSTKFKKLIK